jgi:predicted DNA-binding protein
VIRRDTLYDMKNDRLFSFRLPSEVLDELERIAQADGRTIGDIVRIAIRDYINRKGGES